MKDCFQNWTIGITGKQSKRLHQNSAKIFHFFVNIKIPETFDCCREINVQVRINARCRIPGFNLRYMTICSDICQEEFRQKSGPDTETDILPKSGRI